MVVNGRRLILEAVIRLVEQLDDDYEFKRKGNEVTISPDPLALLEEAVRESSQAELVKRLVERQDASDRQIEHERSWWRRVRYRLTGRW
jgi:septation ring formation regulator EzrA